MGIEFPFFKRVEREHETCTKCWSTLIIHHGGCSHITTQVETRKHNSVEELLVSLSKISGYFWEECA